MFLVNKGDRDDDVGIEKEKERKRGRKRKKEENRKREVKKKTVSRYRGRSERLFKKALQYTKLKKRK